MIKSRHWFWAWANIFLNQAKTKTIKSRNRNQKSKTSRCSCKMKISSNRLCLRRKSSKKSSRIQSNRARWWWTGVNPPSSSNLVVAKDKIIWRYWSRWKFRSAVSFATTTRLTIAGEGRSNNSCTARRLSIMLLNRSRRRSRWREGCKNAG